MKIPAMICAALLLASACRSNPECFGADECGGTLACVDGECIDPTLADVNWQRNVQPIVATKCQTCHTAPLAQGAPFPLITYADTQAIYAGEPIHARMAARVSSPANPMPPNGQPQLTDMEITTIVEWSARGAAQGPTMSTCDGGNCGPNGTSPLTGTEVAAQLMAGYARADGPTWNPAGGVVMFVDGVVEQLYQAMLPGTPAGILNLAGRPSGMTADNQGNLFITLAGARSVARVDLTGPTNIATAYMGNMLNGPDDIVRRSDGTLYFTDPGFDTPAADRQLDFTGLFRIPTGNGQPIAEWEGLPSLGPSGLALSIDETLLYMSDAIDGLIRVFDVGIDGALSNERAFAYSQSGSPEGLAIDTNGNLYVAAAAGVEVYSPMGEYFDVIRTPSPAIDLAFVGQTLNALFVTTPTTVYVIQLTVTGVR